MPLPRRRRGYEMTMSAPEEEKKNRRRGRSNDQRKPTRKNSLAENRRHSTGDLSERVRSSLRVKSQYESLKKKGLSASMSDGSGRRHNVEFAFLEVREFPMILGDNPACLEGPPVTIDWTHDPNTQFVLDINTFERMRGSRRDTAGLLLSKSNREKKLLKGGVTKKDMAAVVREIRILRHKRMVSQQQVSLDNMHESMEKVTHGLKKLFVFKKSDYQKTLEAQCEVLSPVATQPTKYALSA